MDYNLAHVRFGIMGPPNAGKGTQSQRLKDKFGIAHLSTGDMLRKMAEQSNALGRKIKEILSKGMFAPDDLMIETIDQSIMEPDCANGFILDGFPRTIVQAAALDKMLSSKNIALDHFVELVVDDEALVERCCGRFTCAKCNQGYHDKFSPLITENKCDTCGSSKFTRRPDDTPEILGKRLNDYHEITQPIAAYYKEKGLLRRIDGMAPMDEVTKQIISLFA